MGVFAVCPLPNALDTKPDWTVPSHSGASASMISATDPEVGLYQIDHALGDLASVTEQQLIQLPADTLVPVHKGYLCGGPNLTLQKLKAHIRSIQTVHLAGRGECVWPWFDIRYMRAFLVNSSSSVKSCAWGPIDWIVHMNDEGAPAALNMKDALPLGRP